MATLTSAGVTFGDATSQVSARTGPRAQVFTASGTFTVPAGITSVRVKVFGGGGGGLGATSGGGCSGTPGAPGSVGGLAVAIVTGLTPGGTVSVTVGGGGAGGTANNAGQSVTAAGGGTSSFGTFVTATGGASTTFSVSAGRIQGGTIGVGSVSGATALLLTPTAVTGLQSNVTISPLQSYDTQILSSNGGAGFGASVQNGNITGGPGGPGMSGGGAGGVSGSTFRSLPGLAYGPGSNGVQPAAGVLTGGAGGGTGGGAGGAPVGNTWGGGGGGGAGGVIVEW